MIQGVLKEFKLTFMNKESLTNKAAFKLSLKNLSGLKTGRRRSFLFEGELGKCREAGKHRP